MQESYKKIARILRTSGKVIADLDSKMSALTGQIGVIDDIVKENELLVDKTLIELGLTRQSTAEEVYNALIKRLMEFDQRLYEFLDKPDLANMSLSCGKLCETLVKIYPPPKGLFIKREKAVELLERYRPDNLIEHFGYHSVSELIAKEGFASVMAALRFAQSQEWMHRFFEEAYTNLKPSDFEERDVEFKILDMKWLDVAEKFLKKKYHNVSHLKEYGIIFVVPIRINDPGELTRMFTLMMHYLHEVPFYSGLFRRYFNDPDFHEKFKSLLRGDVPSGPIFEQDKVVWRIIQRYIAKDNENDPRLTEPHINPEAEHWFRAEQDLVRLSRILGEKGEVFNIGYWTGLDFIGDFFQDRNGREILISFDLIDLIMSLVDKGRVKYLYHHEEALWNKIFAEYMGRETMDRLIEENIISGFIKL